jgi:hypothetical protein
MQDPRIRLAAASILSISAFISIQGAVFVFLWWLVFSPGFALAKKIRVVLPLILMTGFFSMVLELFQGNGISYFIRMTAIILIGMWVYAEQRPGDFLDISVWLLGNGAGFDLGLVAEMAMQSLSSIITDVERIRLAAKIKGVPWGVRSIIPAALIFVHGALARAGDSAELLAVRGYCSGGTWCPVFSSRPRDIIAGLSALCGIFFALIPVSEFFILYR